MSGEGRARFGRAIGVTLLITSGGCAGLFGFDFPTKCELNSDCPSDEICAFGQCSVGCRDRRDCPTGQTCSPDQMCVLDATADGGAEDASDGEDDPCGACASGICRGGRCLIVSPFGFFSDFAEPSAPFVVAGPGLNDAGEGQMTGVLVHLPAGTVLKLGVLTRFGGVHGFLGLYSSANDQPSQLLASSGEFVAAGDPEVANPQPTLADVTPTVIAEADYWIIGMWPSSVFYVDFQGSEGCTVGCVPWYQWSLPYGPLPDAATPLDSKPVQPTPVLYALIAQ